MNILIESRVFHPLVGGMEKVAQQLAEAWEKREHKVQIVTQTKLGGAVPLDKLNVHRNPSVWEWKQLASNADIFVQSGISLKSMPVGLLAGKPIVIIHHNMLPVSFDTVGARMQLKKWATHLGYNIAVSAAVARDIPSEYTTVIHNPFVPSFKNDNLPAEMHNLLFVGRLVSVKGIDIALKALKLLPDYFTLTVCGDGPERDRLEQFAKKLGIEPRVDFKGWVNHDELAAIAKNAAIQLVPSRYEPFGIVALEAIAANCMVVAAETGGLPEAVGPCGILVKPGNPRALKSGIEKAVAQRDKLLRHKSAHLKKFEIDRIAEKYLTIFKKVIHEAN